MLKRRSRLVAPFVILLVGAGLVAILVATRPRVVPETPEAALPIVRVQRVEPRAFQFVVEAQGTVVPRRESELVPQVSGEVLWVSPALAPGGFFEDDELLLRIDAVDYEAELERARAVLARAESEARRARKELRRQRSLAGRSVASEARIDDAENAQRVAEASLREARAALGRAERDLARTELRAPYAGRVRSKQVDLGQFVNRGTPLAKLYAVDYAEVRLPLPDRELRFLDLPLSYRGDARGSEGGESSAAPPLASPGPAPAPEVRLRAEFAGEEHVWSGSLVRTEGEIDPRSRMVTVVARVEDPYGRADAGERPPLAVGLFVRAEILGRIVPDAVVLPRGALHEGDRVLVLDAENRLRFRPVEVVRHRREEVVIRGGVVAGERVCVSPLPGAVEGMAVRVFGGDASLARAES